MEEEVEFVLAEAIVMPYSEEFSQGVIFGFVFCLLMLDAERRRQNQRESTHTWKPGREPQEHDERFS